MTKDKSTEIRVGESISGDCEKLLSYKIYTKLHF